MMTLFDCHCRCLQLLVGQWHRLKIEVSYEQVRRQQLSCSMRACREHLDGRENVQLIITAAVHELAT